jgi:hypothetical protein
MPPQMKTVQVGSHIAEISFGGAKIPLSFLVSHRKKHHTACEPGGGFVVRVKADKSKVYTVCECVTPRAVKKLKQVGVAGFEQLAAAWLAAEKLRIEEHEAQCRKEGYDAALDEICPYEEKTDQAIAWAEGRAKKLAESERAGVQSPSEAPPATE